ncbi:hypothetical protein E2C01_093972 [Portunus trituberculatus]|uniref:Uncharacterized protein n=1 Tax=Portunus trituberculatus TaxID=210409 RepID=A0A5B7K077_PORTR|nr:hypothetical protein [Portunus trituberculatus]
MILIWQVVVVVVLVIDAKLIEEAIVDVMVVMVILTLLKMASETMAEAVMVGEEAEGGDGMQVVMAVGVAGETDGSGDNGHAKGGMSGAPSA